jgi:Family of unknown function (DUF5343)
MADKHPYMSGGGALVKAIQYLRKSLPARINASVLRKLGLAPKNESYLINILQFIKVIKEDGTPTDEARSVFTQHDDAAFSKGFSAMVKKAYTDLFSLRGDDTWSLDLPTLVTYFRQSDQTSDVVGTRQATTFQTLAALSGHREEPAPSAPASRKEKPVKQKAKTEKEKEIPIDKATLLEVGGAKGRHLGLTVRIEINLPASGDQETYDKIFKSIRENLLNV